MDIWMCEIKNDYKSVINGKHPCLILSQWRTNIRKNGSINVIPLTSNLVKYVDTHIDLKGYNLKNESKAMCNEILTIDKLNALFCIGKVTDLSTQLQIEKAVQTQLDLSRSNFDALDLENLFVDNNNTVKQCKVELEKLKNQLFISHKNKTYKESIVLADNLKELALSLKDCDTNQEFLWYATYMHSLSDLYLNNLDSALKNVQECFCYISNVSDFGTNYSLSLYLTANIAEDMKDTQKACRIYQALTKHYKSNNENILRISTLYNVALMKNNHKAMRNIYKILEKVVTTNRSIYSNEEYKQNLIIEMRAELNALNIQF